MTMFSLLLAFLAGIACGFALRPGLDRRRRLRSAYRAARARRRETAPTRVEEPGENYAVPRDYYLADRRHRGTLAEDFGLRRRAEDRVAGNPPETDAGNVPLPRDYYERETPDDEGLLSEGYGLRRNPPPQDAA